MKVYQSPLAKSRPENYILALSGACGYSTEFKCGDSIAVKCGDSIAFKCGDVHFSHLFVGVVFCPVLIRLFVFFIFSPLKRQCIRIKRSKRSKFWS